MYICSHENIPKKLLIEKLNETEQELKKYQERFSYIYSFILHSYIRTYVHAHIVKYLHTSMDRYESVWLPKMCTLKSNLSKNQNAKTQPQLLDYWYDTNNTINSFKAANSC